jgi:hypothetical protein
LINTNVNIFQLHIVNYDSVNYASIGKAMTEPGGLAVLGVLFMVRHSCSKFCLFVTLLIAAIRRLSPLSVTGLQIQTYCFALVVLAVRFLLHATPSCCDNWDLGFYGLISRIGPHI